MPENEIQPSSSYGPTPLDGILMLMGFAASGVFTPRIPIEMKSHNGLDAVFPGWLAMPAGAVLLWPLLYRLQLLRGRSEPLTKVEIVWAIAWLLHLGWVTAAMLTPSAEPGSTVIALSLLRGFLGVQSLLSLAAVALGGMTWASRQTVPWTHASGSLLLGWYLVPALLYFFGIVQMK